MCNAAQGSDVRDAVVTNQAALETQRAGPSSPAAKRPRLLPALPPAALPYAGTRPPGPPAPAAGQSFGHPVAAPAPAAPGSAHLQNAMREVGGWEKSRLSHELSICTLKHAGAVRRAHALHHCDRAWAERRHFPEAQQLRQTRTACGNPQVMQRGVVEEMAQLLVLVAREEGDRVIRAAAASDQAQRAAPAAGAADAAGGSAAAAGVSAAADPAADERPAAGGAAMQQSPSKPAGAAAESSAVELVQKVD